MNLDMCDANDQKHPFQISQHIKVVYKSWHDILQVIVQKLCFFKQNSVHLCEKD